MWANLEGVFNMDQATFIKTYATNRLNTNSLKWDALGVRYGNPDLLPMWVADMEFKVPEQVTTALTERVAHGIYGYSFTPDSYYDAFINWEQQRHQLTLQKDWVRFGTGVVNSLYAIVNAYTQPGDAVMILTPVYYPFFDAIQDNHRQLVTSELINDDGHYTMDFADIEAKIKANEVRLFIQCSPHNPVGRIWTAEEETKILALCEQYGVLVVSDEIHQDIEIDPENHPFISALTVADGRFQDQVIVVNSPSKTFNVACLLNSHVIIPNADLRATYDAFMQRYNQTEVNVLGQTAGQAAYEHGGAWLDQILAVIRDNYHYLQTEFSEKTSKIVVADLQGTYLIWLDLRAYLDPATTREFIQDKCGLAVDFGEWFSKNDQGFVRLNLATDPKYVHQAVQNIISCLAQLNK
ncbi:aminotransferase [Lactobacillus sp.] [Lactiplantibacillus mudanjiangensis]|uniref:cysteine-S-conjugate beta-lyase n=2 Tax=Lactiplantibacillus mudanjiangensis TaxID=1296538 RepID=A0A660DZG2_9LACO|nr:aminotransferase [Lactobacillus sp.] [Lactiplantibacillus mudanjiangensis]VDG25377.1 aminotransferase [Lactobacillus sp.] [Lactiplantibacillus mudanjiangensis]VDG27592.1 aminotransferase [Lactobacillus sp.] [Lactiplantibacillus mudanjiangensis]VDG32943.1 aminotransferase [Lactobacillus sp.] [Lactiplantibacillus mudanjiangensis]